MACKEGRKKLLYVQVQANTELKVPSRQHLDGILLSHYRLSFPRTVCPRNKLTEALYCFKIEFVKLTASHS